MTFFQRHPSSIPTLLYGGAAIVSTLLFSYVHSLGLVNAFVDAKSHLLQSIQMVHSLTPGISQLGFWPPLLHILLLPAIIVLPHAILLKIGAFLTMLPLLLLGAHFLYGICRTCDVGPRVSLLAPALFVFHPLIQYFVSSSMAELPLIVTVLGSTYYAVRWSRKVSVVDLSMFAIFVSLATLSRYEGLALVPLSILFVAIQCWSLRMPWAQMQAILFTFTFVAVLGACFILVYSTVYAGSPMAFLSLGAERISVASPSSSSSSSLLPRFLSSVTYTSVVDSLNRLYRGSLHMHGGGVLFFTAIGTVGSIVLRRRWHDVVVFLFLLSPAMFIFTMMSIGRNEISVPELPRQGLVGEPYGYFYNARFALTWVGAAIVPIVFFVDSLMRRRLLHVLAAWIVVPSIVIASLWQFSMVLFGNTFIAIRDDEQSLGGYTAESLAAEGGTLPGYDSGRVLFTRYYSEELMLLSDVPLSRFVYEGNYQYFDQALREPWLFVRWVLVRHYAPGDRGVSVDSVKILRDMLAMEATPEFQYYYELVRTTPSIRYYKLRENVLRDQALVLGYDPLKIPSLNPQAKWRPKTFYEDLQRVK